MLPDKLFLPNIDVINLALGLALAIWLVEKIVGWVRTLKVVTNGKGENKGPESRTTDQPIKAAIYAMQRKVCDMHGWMTPGESGVQRWRNPPDNTPLLIAIGEKLDGINDQLRGLREDTRLEFQR